MTSAAARSHRSGLHHKLVDGGASVVVWFAAPTSLRGQGMDRKQIERTAAVNHYLRGLIALPVGAVLIAAALGNMKWGPFRPLWVVPVVIAVAGAAYLMIARSYNDSYGRVTPTANARTVARTVLAVAVMV